MTPMSHAEAIGFMLTWADLLADDNYTVLVGFDSDGPVILVKAARQGNVLQWLL